MAEAGLALLVAAVSGLVPLINIELYLVGAVVAVDDGALVAMAVAAGLGQTLGKLPYYYVGRGSLEIPWFKRRARTPGKWAARAEAWRARAEDSPVWGMGLLAVSSLVSVPPFMVVSVLAGVVRMGPVAFCTVTLLTRTARFLVVVFAPAWALSVLPA
ncbi:YqaA family protein [Nocardiopsis salina]|uniref:membrane protein n=1 Tax=Nocardiopsis salina TaxID=245836 RepID=UPI000347F490|nr:membrane protein [Nocardiopsis salina]